MSRDSASLCGSSTAGGLSRQSDSLHHSLSSIQRSVQNTSSTHQLPTKAAKAVRTRAMGKKNHIQVPHRHLHSRISYLYQAANYLSQVSSEGTECPRDSADRDQDGASLMRGISQTKKPVQGISEPPTADIDVSDSHSSVSNKKESSNRLGQGRRLVSHLRIVSLKSQIRLSSSVKHSVCRRCENLLIPGSTSTFEMENKSRGGRKPWADVLVVTCKHCGTARRLPTGATRQPSRKERNSQTDCESEKKHT